MAERASSIAGELVEVPVESLDGMPLDWLVAQAMQLPTQIWHKRSIAALRPGARDYAPFCPSLGSEDGYAIIEREHIHAVPADMLGHGYTATKWKLPLSVKLGNELVCKSKSSARTPFVAAMRCYCLAHFGENARVPQMLVQASRRDIELTLAQYGELVRLRERDTHLRQLCCQPGASRSAHDAAADFEVQSGDRLRELEAKLDDLPAGTTHMAEFYGRLSYYRLSTYQRLNQVSEQWMTEARWAYFDRGDWQPVGSGFSSRRLLEIAIRVADDGDNEGGELDASVTQAHPESRERARG